VRRSLRGAVYASDHPVEGAHQWRRGAAWRIWTDGEAPPGGTRVSPDLGDVLIAAAFDAHGAAAR